MISAHVCACRDRSLWGPCTLLALGTMRPIVTNPFGVIVHHDRLDLVVHYFIIYNTTNRKREVAGGMGILARPSSRD